MRIPSLVCRDRVAQLARKQGFDVQLVPVQNTKPCHPYYFCTTRLQINGRLTRVYSLQSKKLKRNKWYAPAKVPAPAEPAEIAIHHMMIAGESERTFVTTTGLLRRTFSANFSIPLYHIGPFGLVPWHAHENAWGIFVAPPDYL
jgi:hypothetical protein